MMMMEPPLPPAQEPQQPVGNQEDEEGKGPSQVSGANHAAATEAPAELSKSARGLVRMCDLLLKKKQQRQRRQQGAAGALPASPTGAGPPGRSRRQKRSRSSRTASSSDTDKSSDSGSSSQDDEEEEEEVSEVGNKPGALGKGGGPHGHGIQTRLYEGRVRRLCLYHIHRSARALHC